MYLYIVLHYTILWRIRARKMLKDDKLDIFSVHNDPVITPAVALASTFFDSSHVYVKQISNDYYPHMDFNDSFEKASLFSEN